MIQNTTGVGISPDQHARRLARPDERHRQRRRRHPWCRRNNSRSTAATSTTTATAPPTTACSSARLTGSVVGVTGNVVDPQQLDQRQRAQRRAHPQHSGTHRQPDGHEQHVQRRQRYDRRQRVPVRGVGHVDDHRSLHHRQHVRQQHAAARARGPGARYGDGLGLRGLGKHVHQQRHPRQLHAGHLEQSRVLFRQQRHRRHADDRQHPAGRQRLLVVTVDGGTIVGTIQGQLQSATAVANSGAASSAAIQGQTAR